MEQRKIKNKGKRALITGGSSGIGFEFARQLADSGCNLIIVSQDSQRLSESADRLRAEFAVEVEAINVDLSDRDGVSRLVKVIESRQIDFMINNAGFALHDSLLDANTNKQELAFAVMAEAVLKLSGAAARAMKSRGSGRIINVGSSSSWLFAGNYSALKRWVLVYTESLNLELRRTGVSATAVCPGWVKTNFHENGGVSRPDLPNWVWIPVATVVKSALRAAEKGKSYVVPTIRWKAMIFAVKHSELIARAFSRKLVVKRVKELEQKSVGK